MITPALIESHDNPVAFLTRALHATTTDEVEALLAKLPIVPEDKYTYSEEDPEKAWEEGKFHWLPVGRDRGNAGRIKLANQPVNPIAERTVNGMEAIIELARARELRANLKAPAPSSPRDAVKRYFNLPSLDLLPKLDNSPESKKIRVKARDEARHLRVRLLWDKVSREFTVAVEDDGIGQPPSMVHRTLLSLGSTTKADKPYLIGVFGQGGSSAFAVSKYSWIMSRRANDLLDGESDGISWTIVRHVFPKGRRDDYFAYLACHPDGRVPWISTSHLEDGVFTTGTRFVHIGYNFGRGGSAITRKLFTALNHVLYNPILPFELYAQRPTADTIFGNAYRLSSLKGRMSGKGLDKRSAMVLDKTFPAQVVGK